MQITKIKIKNVLGIEAMEFEPGKITSITGPNGSGKTSFLEALKGAVKGGHCAELIRNGSDEAQIVLEMDDGAILEKIINRKEATVKFVDGEGKKIKKAPSYLKEIIDPIGLNPVKILTAEPKELTKILLDCIPLTMPKEEIQTITKMKLNENESRHPLQVIEEFREMIFNDRAETNKEIKTKTTMKNEMQKTIPFKQDEKNWEQLLSESRSTLADLEEDKRKQRMEADDLLSKNLAHHKTQAQEKIDAINADLSKRIEAENKNYIETVEIIDNITTPPIEAAKKVVTENEVNFKNQAKIKGAENFIETKKQEIEDLQKDADQASDQLTKLDNLKNKLLVNLPVKGMTVEDGQIKIDGVPFDSLNTASRIRFALMVAGLRKSELPLVCVDGLEVLDSETYELFKDEVSKTDMQLFMTVVSDEEKLTVEKV